MGKTTKKSAGAKEVTTSKKKSAKTAPKKQKNGEEIFFAEVIANKEELIRTGLSGEEEGKTYEVSRATLNEVFCTNGKVFQKSQVKIL